jgi:hypothetical protein
MHILVVLHRKFLGQSLGFFVPGCGFESKSLVEFGLTLGAQKSTAPVLSDFFGSLIVVGGDGLDQLGQVLFVFVLDVSERDTGALFSANKLSESCLTLDNAVWNVHLSAKSWKIDNDFDWVDVVGNDNELGGFSFDEVDDLVDTAGQAWWSLSRLIWLSVSACLGTGHESSLLLSLRFWGVLLGELEELGSRLLVQSLAELVDAWGNLESLLENGALALKLDVLWPSNESSQIALWLNILANAKVLASLLEERVGGGLLLAHGSLAHWSRSYSLTFSHHRGCY